MLSRVVRGFYIHIIVICTLQHLMMVYASIHELVEYILIEQSPLLHSTIQAGSSIRNKARFHFCVHHFTFPPISSFFVSHFLFPRSWFYQYRYITDSIQITWSFTRDHVQDKGSDLMDVDLARTLTCPCAVRIKVHSSLYTICMLRPKVTRT